MIHSGVSTISGDLYADFEDTPQSKEASIRVLDSSRINVAFLTKVKLGLSGVVIVFKKISKEKQGTHHTLLTTFDVLSLPAPIPQAVKDSGLGVFTSLETGRDIGF